MICLACVTHPSLRDLISCNGKFGTCRYCRNDGTTIKTKFLFDYIYECVRENVAVEDDLSHFEHAMLYECGSDEIEISTYDVIFEDWFNLEGEVFTDELCDRVPEDFKINNHGKETHFYKDTGLLEHNFYENKWANFIDEIRHAHRFFNPNARSFLDSVFKFLVSSNDELKPEVIRTLNQGNELFRARSADSYEKAKEIAENPASQLGPTPKDKASSQRMTPNGISALYCALERSTCLSEIRSITGDDVISVALTPTTTLKLLDLTKLEEVEVPKLTFLDMGYRDALHLKTFLRSLVKKMSKPRGRNDELSYLSTQVVFEYLRLRFGKQVDGLVFPSVQTGNKGTNLVLFPEASVISKNEYELPHDIDIALDVKSPVSFVSNEKLAVINGSLRFHKIKAIKTEATTYRTIHDFYMSDEVRNRFGFSIDTDIDEL